MNKMEFLKRKHFSLWIITIIFAGFIQIAVSIQGAPTWICLGIKSPFIEFRAEIEMLANTSISLNITKDEQALIMHQEGIQKIGSFVKPVDLRNSTTGFVRSNLTKKVPTMSAIHRRRGMTENPIIEEMNQKDIELLEEDPNDQDQGFAGLTDEDRKFIVPMALKNPITTTTTISTTTTILPRQTSSITTLLQFPITTTNAVLTSSNFHKINSLSTTTTPLPPPMPLQSSLHLDTSSNIEDLKNHILMLQNLTKNDKSFQSKFVVFPSIQRERNNTSSTLQSAATISPIFQLQRRIPMITPPSTPLTRRPTLYEPSIYIPEPTKIDLLDHSDSKKENMKNNHDHNEEFFNKEKITIIPQVLLLNDQTPPDDDDDDADADDEHNHEYNYEAERRRIDERNRERAQARRKNNLRKQSNSGGSTTIISSSGSGSTVVTTTTQKPFRNRNNAKRPRNGERRNKKRQQNCKNLDTPKCQRQQRRRQLQQQQKQQQQQQQLKKKEHLVNLSLNVNKTGSAAAAAAASSISSTAFAQLAESPIHIAISGNNNNQSYDTIWQQKSHNSNNNNKNNDELKLSRSIRSHHNRRNTGGTNFQFHQSYNGGGGGGGSMTNINNGMGMMVSNGGGNSMLPTYYDGGSNRDFIIPIGGGNGNIINNNQSSSASMPYKETIDINPELCYKVDGMTYGQQKLCIMHTSIMPAISRGARSAIQECKHQFKNRRWNCSTTEDNTVFGPMSTIGSPEMAFIHALSAATVTSFIARACRDGQLTACGCSRSVKPKQLNDDWTWGGCGDDLEFAYKFAQEFIDVREKERKRGIRGLVSVPPKHKLDENHFNIINTTLNANATMLANVTTSEQNYNKSTVNSLNDNTNNYKSDDLIELQEKITKEILNSKLQEKEMLELQEKINRELMNSKVFNLDHHVYGSKKHSRNGGGSNNGGIAGGTNAQYGGRFKNGMSAKARSLMNLHNNEAGRRAVIKKTRITCKCHGVSGSCSMITCWQQLSSIREIGDYLREKYDAATEVKLNKRGRLQVKDPHYKVPTAHDLVYLDESPDWCRNNKQLQWPGTHGRICNKTSSGLDGCGILCCGRGYNTKNIVVRERCNCKFHWCCHVKCEICVKVLEEHTCK